jgi:hypothetical protein
MARDYLSSKAPQEITHVTTHHHRSPADTGETATLLDVNAKGTRVTARGLTLLSLIRSFEAQIFLDDLRHIFFGDFHIPEPFGPDHHVRSKRADVQTAASDDTDFAFEIALFGDFPEFLDDCLGAAEAAGRALALSVVDANMKLPDVRLLSFDHGSPLDSLTSQIL